MLKKTQYYIARAKDWHATYKKEIRLTSQIKIADKLLAQELEQECNRRNGILTYAEYLTHEQFGKHGFYQTSTYHGQTDVEKRWGRSLANYSVRFGHDTIIEVGCGTGELGVATVTAYKKLTGKQLSWIGVEIDKSIHPTIFQNFKSAHAQDAIEAIVTKLEELQTKNNALIVFPYCLDNIPPQIFTNTRNQTFYPDALLGITVADGMLSEIIIPDEVLKEKGIKLQNGLFTQKGHTSKLTSWKLRKGQRAYIPVDAYITIYQYAKTYKNATMIIIDEFAKISWAFSLNNIGTPKSLYEKNLQTNDRARYYRESGQHNLYYPLYKDTLLKFLHAIGFTSIEYDIEQKIAAQLQGKPWLAVGKNYTTHAFIAKNFVEKKNDVLSIPFNLRKLY